MSSIFKTFGTDKTAEVNGVWIKYEGVRFLIARAGGSNHEYRTVFNAKTKPYRSQIDRNTLPQSEQERLTAEIFAEAIVKKVEVDVDGKWVEGIPTPDGKLVESTKANLVALFLELPELFKDLSACAADAAHFTKEEVQADAKNSKKS